MVELSSLTSVKRKISINHLIYCLIVGIFITIFFQQVFVINIGGSFKIYELVALILLGIFLLVDRPRIYGIQSEILFVLFVIIPSIGIIIYYISPLPYDYYSRFPNARNVLRTNIIIAPAILLIYYWFTWIVINYIISSKELYVKRRKVITLFISIATIVSIYNLYAFVFVRYFGFPDLIPGFLDFRNSPTYKTGRFGGFSDEPGTYIILQTWVVYYLILWRPHLKRLKLVTSLNFISWLMTMSSLLVPGILILIIGLFVKNKKNRPKVLITIAVFCICVILIVKYYNLEDAIKYVGKEKIENYIYGADHTLDSGSYRNFTTRLGFRLFQDYPIIGAGAGTSCFFIWHYENEMGIRTWGERITETTYPQNTYAKIAGELGLCGLLTFISFFIYVIIKQSKYVKKSPFMLASFAGTIFIAIAYTSTYPETSLFFWLNIAISCNYIYHSKNGLLSGHKENQK